MSRPRSVRRFNVMLFFERFVHVRRTVVRRDLAEEIAR